MFIIFCSAIFYSLKFRGKLALEVELIFCKRYSCLVFGLRELLLILLDFGTLLGVFIDFSDSFLVLVADDMLS